MKYIATLSCLLLSFITTPAFAAIQGNDCAARGEKVKPAEHEAFMKSCLAQAANPSNVKEVEAKQKSALCEQNAKNKKLQGGDKSNYQSNCMNKNEAAVVASAQPSNDTAPAQKTASSSKPKKEAHKAVAKENKEHKKAAKKHKKAETKDAQ